MLKILNACTFELNDSEKAVQDIHNQLDLKNNRLKNSVALLFCHIKFIETGMSEIISKSLPFDVLGCSSQSFAMSGTPVLSGEIMLTITVLTGDDVEFFTGLSEPLCKENAENNITSMYEKTVSSFGAEPSLIFVFLPMMLDLTCDVLTGALDRACGGIPVFGSVALDIDTGIRNPQTIYQENSYSDRASLLLIKGPVKPKFFSILFPGKTVFFDDAVVTAAEGNSIISINYEPAVSFVEKLGFMGSGGFSLAIPLLIEEPDGTGLIPVILHGTEGDTLLCSRQIETGVTLRVGMVTRDDVLESMNTLIQNIKKDGTGLPEETGLIIFSCALRIFILEGSHVAETELLQKELGNFSVPYLYICSGGEICPKLTASGNMVNGLYQYALVACLL